MSSGFGDALGDRPSRRDLIRFGLLGAAGIGLSGAAPGGDARPRRVRRVSRRQVPQKICPLYLVGMMGPYFYYMGTTCPFEPMNLKVTAITSLTPLTIGCSGGCVTLGGAGARGAGAAPDGPGLPDHVFHPSAAGAPSDGLDRPLADIDSFHARPGTSVEIDDVQVPGRKKAVRLCVVTVRPFEVDGEQFPGGHRLAFGLETDLDANGKHPKVVAKKLGKKYHVLSRKVGDDDINHHTVMFHE